MCDVRCAFLRSVLCTCSFPEYVHLRLLPFTSRYLFIALCLFPIGDVKMGSYGEPLRVGSQRRVILPARMLKRSMLKRGTLSLSPSRRRKWNRKVVWSMSEEKFKFLVRSSMRIFGKPCEEAHSVSLNRHPPRLVFLNRRKCARSPFMFLRRWRYRKWQN